MAKIEEINNVAKTKIEKVSCVSSDAVEKVSGLELITFATTTYTITNSGNWDVPAGANHIMISVIGGGSAGRNSNVQGSGGGGAGAGSAQNAKAVVGNITTLAIVIGAANRNNSAGGAGTQSTVSGTGLSTMTANGGALANYSTYWANNAAAAGGTASGGNTNTTGGVGGEPDGRLANS